MASKVSLLILLLTVCLLLPSVPAETIHGALDLSEHMIPTTGLDAEPDPTCARGAPQGAGRNGQVCCAPGCSPCSGNGCNRQPLGSQCCSGAIKKTGRGCDTVGPPCLIGYSSKPSPSASPSIAVEAMPSTMPSDPGMPSNTASPEVEDESPRWVNVTDRFVGLPRKRHEACFVWVRGKGYLLGGRGMRGVDILDPKAGGWTRGADPPVEMHHMQCVAYKKSIYVVSSWFGRFPKEENNPKMWVYNTKKDRWRRKAGLPADRRRGGAASVLHDNKIYVVGGNRGGHGTGSVTLGWMDYYDLRTKKWVTGLPDLPAARDHFGGAMVNGMLCVAGGRRGSAKKFFEAVIKSTYCFDFTANEWRNMNADIPAGRAGAATGTTCDGKMMIAGGEAKYSAAFSQVDVFDGVSWETIAPLQRARHGSGLGITRCDCGQIFIASGSGARGGSPELESTEVYLPDGRDAACSKY